MCKCSKKTKNKKCPKKKTKATNGSTYSFYINDNEKNEDEYKFKNNSVKTTKYNYFTFLPKALLFQFIRLANVYFLICAIIQCIPAISPLGPVTAIIPLVIVLSVSLIREGIEDYQRSKLDKEQNNEPAEVYRNGDWQTIKSGKLKIGEIVEVEQDRVFLADLILIDSDLPEGIGFIETGSLDGEKTLKLKQSPKQTSTKFVKNGEKINVFSISGEVTADFPNPELYFLNGKMKLLISIGNEREKQLDIPIDAKQLLLKGAKLRNTRSVIGIVVYTGHNCKIMKNAKDPKIKLSTVERLMNKSLIFILIVQTVLSIICAVLRGIYFTKNLNYDGIGPLTEFSYPIEGLITYFTYILLLNTMIPISLIISLEIAKLIQGYFISNDVEGYSKGRDKYISPNSVSLNEELGLVNYIFSDKTGTLTCNKMIFKYCVIGDICYEFIRSTNLPSEGEAFRKHENIIPFTTNQMYNYSIDQQSINNSFYPNFKVISSFNPNCTFSLEQSSKIIQEFWQALALCHDCTIQVNDDNEEEYIGMSPDSIELVKSAKMQGFTFIESGTPSIKRLKLGVDGNTTKDFERLQLIEFSSDRKRETIIVRESTTGLIKLYIKGADSIIEERLSSNNKKGILGQCKSYVNKFSSQGFRTLFIGMKIIDKDEYEKFAYELNEANLDMNNKDKKIAEVINSIERDIYLIGATIVEDKLQDKVPETIMDLRLGGIKIWMLTGDKMNTAYNIGLSCNLITKSLKTFYIEGLDPIVNTRMEVTNNAERQDVIINFAKQFNHFKGNYDSLTKLQFCILVDEKALIIINEDEEIQKMFLQIGKDAAAVICCRVSPLQKSQVVKMVKTFEPKAVTLAIGDGGNDVSMIMEAHIGIGIYGEEGMRAVQSGDYAIGEFKILNQLLLFHGRSSYIRNSEIVMYFFYKNFVFTFVQFFYGFYSNFSGQTIVDDWFITLFNLLFTSFPLGTRSCMDFDIKPDDGLIIVKMLPFLYEETRSNPLFTILNFSLTLLRGTIHCVINYFWVIYIIQWPVDSRGRIADLWYMSVNLFTNIILIVTLNLIVYTRYHTWVHAVIIVTFTFLGYIIFIIISHNFLIFNSNCTMIVAFGSGSLWLNMLFIVGFCFLIDYGILSIKHIFLPSISTTLSAIISQQETCENDFDLPPLITDKLYLYYNYCDTSPNQTHMKNILKTEENPINSRIIEKNDI